MSVMTWKELNDKYHESRDEMEIERERAFVNDCFNVYESVEPLAETFWTPFEQYEDKIGQRFTVIGRVSEPECDVLALPQWHIVLEDGTEINAYPEEIYKNEQIDNGRKC